MSPLLTASSPAASISILEQQKNEAVCASVLFCIKQDNVPTGGGKLNAVREYLSELTLGQVLRKKIDPCKVEEQVCF